jgi:O-antigen/teichoic acid export membrane protein
MENAPAEGGLTVKAGIISFGKLVTSLSSLAAAAILSRFLSKTDYGTYRQVWLIYNTVAPVLILGLPVSVNYFVPRMKPSEQKALNLQTYLLLAALGLILSLLLFLGAPFVARSFDNAALTEMLRIFSLIPVLTLPTLYYQNLFICLNKARLAAEISILTGITQVGAVVVPVVLGYGIRTVFLSLVVFSVFQLVVVTYATFRPFVGGQKEWTKLLPIDQLKYAIPIGLSGIAGTLTQQVDKIMISTYFLAAQYAIYCNGATEVPLIDIITGSVTAVLMPEFVRVYENHDTQALIRIWNNAIRKVSLIILPTMLFLGVFATEALTFLFSEEYAASAGIFRIYLLALPLRVTNYAMLFMAMGRSGLVFRYSSYTLACNIALNFVLLKVVGFSGPAIGTVLTLYFTAALRLWKIAKLLRTPLPIVVPWRVLGKILSISVVAALPTVVFKVLSPFSNNILNLLVGGGIFGVFYVGGVTLLGALCVEDIRLIGQFFRQSWRK